MRWNLPILLTWLRMLAIPLLVAVYLLPAETASMPMRNLLGTVVFVAAAVTDWFDGWLARRLGQTTSFGAFLDPVADKLLVCAALVLLLELQRVDALVAIIIIGREIAISALREWMAGMGARKSVAVHSLGKLKTVAQLVAIPMLLYHQPLFGVVPVQRIGTWLIWVAALLTLWSMFYYLRQAWPLLRDAS
ncbi:MAG: CDP-diacylglycerol--glycerol-3-phosphate 3-phosphatidyltransferase [Burkholderiaceae bacterium]|jgi:cardiolipin synthase|nr:CDP-diacylglycerol--glycerol-3-phosphate 3-phosphatidyltransferase [Burkholderiales bacterium]MCZ8337075.1 CDP-diacylglycerol--glycerol-3-phosphate 3-phosphatidyltransferase [Burkholderiaceae bacterium]